MRPVKDLQTGVQPCLTITAVIVVVGVTLPKIAKQNARLADLQHIVVAVAQHDFDAGRARHRERQKYPTVAVERQRGGFELRYESAEAAEGFVDLRAERRRRLSAAVSSQDFPGELMVGVAAAGKARLAANGVRNLFRM